MARKKSARPTVAVVGVPTGEAEGEPIELGKRFYVPGVSLESNCPKCGALAETDLALDYLNYPVVGEPYEHTFCCEYDDMEWSCRVVVRVTVEAWDGE